MENKKPQLAEVRLDDFVRNVEKTNIISSGGLEPLLFGLFGEVGGIMSTSKKLLRETAYPEYRDAAEEEFGDALWYLCAICLRLGVSMQAAFDAAREHRQYKRVLVASDLGYGSISEVSIRSTSASKDKALFELGEHAATLLRLRENTDAVAAIVERFAVSYLDALNASELSFSSVLRRNMVKTSGTFELPDFSTLDTFDSAFKKEERIPRRFRIMISERPTGQTYLSMRGVFIGDPLTDAIADPDGYRFHDVFHFAFAAVLHWSPVFRALIKQKRKSDPKYDAPQDGGRAIVVEEGVSALIFSRAKNLGYFKGHKRVPLDILKVIQQFVAGFEVESVPLKMWERAILMGYEVFNELKDAGGGYVVGDRLARTICFEPLDRWPSKMPTP